MNREKHLAKIDKLVGRLLRYTNKSLGRSIPKADLRRMQELEQLVMRYKQNFQEELRKPDLYRILSLLASARGMFKIARSYREKATNLSRAPLSEDFYVSAYNLHHEFASIENTELLAEALEKINIAISGAQNLGDLELLCMSLNRRGVIYVSIGNFANAIKDFREVLSIAEEKGILIEVAYAYCNLGMTHLLNNELGESQSNYEKALEIDRGCKYYIGIERDLFGLARIVEDRNPQMAIKYLRKCLKLTKKYIANLRTELNICDVLSVLYDHIGKKRLAQKFGRRAEELRITLRRLNQ